MLKATQLSDSPVKVAQDSQQLLKLVQGCVWKSVIMTFLILNQQSPECVVSKMKKDTETESGADSKDDSVFIDWKSLWWGLFLLQQDEVF